MSGFCAFFGLVGLTFIVLAVFAAYKDNKPNLTLVLGLFASLCFCIVGVEFGRNIGTGLVMDASELSFGQQYECVSEPVQVNDKWYVLAIIGNNKEPWAIFFKEKPFSRGVLMKINGFRRFMPVESIGTLIENPEKVQLSGDNKPKAEKTQAKK